MQALKTGEAYINFCGTLKTKATQRQYLWVLKRYAAFRKTFDLDAIIEEDSKQPIKLTVACIREFLLGLQSQRLSAGSMNNYKAVLKHFYEMNDISLNWKKINKFGCMEGDNAGIREKDRAYAHKDIQQMLAHCSSIKTKALIMLMASSGVRVGAIRTLLLKHLTKIEIDSSNSGGGLSLYQLVIYPGHKDEYITFCSTEATEAIDSYLAYRSRVGEKLHPLSPVFRTDFFDKDLFKVRNNIVPLSVPTIQKIMQSILRRAGLLSHEITTESDKRARHQVQCCHGFRKFANTQMVLSEVNGAAKEMLLGHSIGLDDKYYRPTPAQLLEQYTKAIDRLTINDENRLRAKVDELTVKTSEISTLKNQMDELRDIVSGSSLKK